MVDNPPDDARVVVEEPFGSLVPLLRFSEVDEVVRRANASEFGLGGSVWSADVEQAKAIENGAEGLLEFTAIQTMVA